MKRIQVLINFGGTLTNEQRIPPGEYAIDDAALWGVGEYLVSEGLAIVVSDEPEAAPEPPPEPPKKKRGQ